MWNKVLRIGTIETYGGRLASVYLKVEIDKGRLSITGVIGPMSNGDALGGCGQIDMEFAHRNPDDDDKRYSNLIQPSDIRFAPGWNAEMWLDLLDVWKKWHLNDVRSECEHQEALGWKYHTHHGDWIVYHRPEKEKAAEEYDEAFTYLLTASAPATYSGDFREYRMIYNGEDYVLEIWNEYAGWKCPTCGYRIGSAWLKRELPDSVVEFLYSLPDADKTPAWV